MPEGKGHPLPRSGEARHGEIPESLEARKGEGDDPRAVVQPEGDPVDPDGESYVYPDPDGSAKSGQVVAGRGETAAETAAHQDRGMTSVADTDEEPPESREG